MDKNNEKDIQLEIAKIKARSKIISKVIGFCAAIITTILGSFSFNINKENKKLQEDYRILEDDYHDLSVMYSDLEEKNKTLQNNYDLLLSEKNSLTNEILELQKQMQTETEIDKNNDEETPSPPNKNTKKVSLFDIDTFMGDAHWFDHSYINFGGDDFVDTYGNEYLSARVAYHYAHDITNTSNPIYLLNNDFSLCQGQIAWSKSDKNMGGSAWIDFYADGELIYSTNPITADDECEEFEFDVHNVKKLTIIQNGTSNNSVKIIYPYFNLIE